MTPAAFRHWRKGLGWKQKDAAEKLGLKKRVIQYYEKGDRDGKPVDIPKTVELACLALALGYETFEGELPAEPSNGRDRVQPDAPVARGARKAAVEAVMPGGDEAV